MYSPPVPRRVAALHVAGGDFADFTSVEGTLPDFWLDAEVFSQQAQLAVEGQHLGGGLEFLGVAYVCPGPCEDFEPIVTFPLDATGAIDPPFLSIDEAWTTGTVVSGGVAWAQERGMGRVEVRIDDGPWIEATMGPDAGIDFWRQWYTPWDATAGEHRIAVRATDLTDATQPEERTSVVPRGATGWHSISVSVG